MNNQPPQVSLPVQNKGGSVLVLVLILLSLAAGLVFQTQISARTALRQEQAGLLNTRLRQAAADAAWVALRKLADDEDLRVDHTNEVWAAPEERRDPSGVSTRVTVRDQDRFFDLNNLAQESPSGTARPAADIIMDLMTACGDFAPVDRTDALQDWMDGNDEGAFEKNLYQGKNPPYEPANRPVYAMSELLLVNGFTRAYFARHERHSPMEVFNADTVDCLTALPGRQITTVPINMNTAGKDVLLGVLGIQQDTLVRMILEYRNATPIRSVNELFSGLGIPVPEPVRPYLDVKSHFFKIDSQAYAEERSQHLQVLARRGSAGEVEVLQWVF